MEKVRKIDLVRERSEEVQEILGTPPSWPVFWGSTVICVVLVIFLIISWAVRYPDEIQAKVVITTETPPYGIVARSSGKIMEMMISEHATVLKDAVLCIIENPANIHDVFHVSQVLDSINSDQTLLTGIAFKENLSLGELQSEYNAFIGALNKYNFYNRHKPLEKEIRALKMQIEKNKQLLKKQIQQKETYKKQVKLLEVDYERDKKLYAESVISEKSLEEKEQVLLSAVGNFETAELHVIDIQIALTELEKELQERFIQNEKEYNDLGLQVDESLKKLRSALSTWRQKYVLSAPIAGKVSFFNYWSSNQFVQEGTEVMTIVPEKNSKIVGKVKMPIQNSGKVKVDQHVNIQLDNYPYEEYGMLQGRIKSISLVPRENMYAIEVDLPNNLMTTYQKELEFKQELQGTAEIVTEDLRLIERIFYQLRKIFV